MEQKCIYVITNDKRLKEIKDPVASTYYSFLEKIEEEENIIYTTQLEGISARYYEMGYNIIICEKDKDISLEELLKGRYIRHTQDWRKMYLAGCLE